MYHRAQLDLKEVDLDPVLEIYGKFKTPGADGAGSDDIAAVQQEAQRAGGHKFQTPKVGTIRYKQGDILARTKAKQAFQGRSEDLLIFTKESKSVPDRKAMQHLVGGDTFYNEWPVTSLPFGQLARCSMAMHDKIFGSKDWNMPTNVC